MFVEAALRSRTHVRVTNIPIDEWTNSENYDLAVFNGIAPTNGNVKNAIWLDVKNGSPVRSRGTVAGGELLVPSSRSQHPVMRYVRFVELEPERIQKIKPRGSETVLARTKRGARAAIVAHSTPKQRWIATGFDPVESEWVTHYSFSVFFVNAINWFFQEESRFAQTLTLAKRWNIDVPWSGAKQVHVTQPTGAKQTALVDDGGRVAFSGQDAGFYEFSAGKDTTQPSHSVAASLANPLESTLESTGTYAPYAPRELQTLGGDDTPGIIGTTPWQFLVLLALGLTLVEWLTYNRRWTV